MITLFTNLTSSLSAAADSKESSLEPSSIGAPSMSANNWSMVLLSADAPNNWASVSLNSVWVVTRYANLLDRGNTWGTTREPLTASGSKHMITSPSGDSSKGIHPCSTMNSRLSAPCSISERMRPALKGSYATPKNLASAPPNRAGLRPKLDINADSLDWPSARASSTVSRSSCSVNSPSATRRSNLLAFLTPPLSFDFFRRWRIAVASVLHNSVTPSTSNSPKGSSFLLLMTCKTPCKWLPSMMGATSICLVRYPERLSTSFKKESAG